MKFFIFEKVTVALFLSAFCLASTSFVIDEKQGPEEITSFQGCVLQMCFAYL